MTHFYIWAVVAFVVPSFFYRVAEFEGRAAYAWAAASFTACCVVTWVLHWGYFRMAVVQASLFAVMFVLNLIQARPTE